MDDELRSYVLQHKTEDWLKPKEVASLAQTFEDSRPRHRSANQRNREVNGALNANRNREPADKNTKGEHRPPPKCYSCDRIGHLQYYWYYCPQDKKGQPAAEEQNKSQFPALTARAL
ncbi:hypothetical protein HPB48_001761 [Haemaphysalis longicornis]|uniref:Uncharacterized protein n=1 Tax=Haemaphysalis longicornis TaxID=44386 RepID=A0A9J6GD45_HAELO|nr:hypothetical protein HPB48_001761 [Haemaphysalis longicornis]